MQDEFESAGSERQTQRRPDCPELSVWYEIAGGVTAPEEAQRHLDHVSTCDFCRPLLRDAVADLNEETTPSEAKEIADLESAQPAWQKKLVQRITGKAVAESAPVAGWRHWITVPRLAFASSAVAAGIVAFLVVARPSPAEQAGKLLARAYGEKRTLKMRMSGMPYAPAGEGMKRDADSSFLDRPSALLQAEVLISKQLASHPSDPNWLQAKARADLMEGKYQSALESLKKANQLAPKSPEILTDFATANFQLGRYNAAYEALSQVLAIKPDDTLALYNRAFTSEQLHLYHQVLDDADRYLQLDPSSKWAEEVRALADSIRALLNRHEHSRQTPLLTPAEIVASANDLAPRVEERIEEYLKEAAVSWLPHAFPEKASSADPAARQALFFLAGLTREHHNDLWLSDLLAGSSAPQFPKAVATLSRAIQANTAGEYNTSARQGRHAELLFGASGNAAGASRAKFEQIYAAQIDQDACKKRSIAAAAGSDRYRYPWLQAQLELETAACSLRAAEVGSDEVTATHAMEIAAAGGYGEVYLRALFFVADDERLTGNLVRSRQQLSAGLERYWSGQFPGMQGYNLYAGMAWIAEAANQPRLACATWEEAVTLIDSDKDLLVRAWAHQVLANAATASGAMKLAQHHFIEAAKLFDLAPRTNASHAAALENEIRSAQLEAYLGRSDDAIVRLISIQNQVRSLTNTYLLQLFYGTLGNLQLGRHRGVEAQQALGPALEIAEKNLWSIHSEADRIRWSKNAAPIYLGLAQTELEQGHTQESLEIFERYLGAPLREHSRKQSGPHPGLSDAAAPQTSGLAVRLPPLSQETVIAFGLLPGGLAIWVYDDRGVNAQWIPQPSQDIHELVERFADLTSDPHSELTAVRRDARSLYQALIAPVEQRLTPGRTLVIEADGLLARVPFEALLDSEGRYLVERWPIVHSLGQDVEARSRDSVPVSADWSALVVGSTAALPGREMISLPDVGAEADSVAKRFSRSKVLKGDEATLNPVQSELASVNLFHFAGHSLAAPERNGLLLQSASSGDKDPALLDADNLRRLALPGLQLAVLSACSTASGNQGSDGFGSVMEALLRAGVPHVVASRWAVDSVVARALVEDFYRNALSGQSVSDAVRLTSRKMMADPRTAHPYYWSAFAAYGRP